MHELNLETEKRQNRIRLTVMLSETTMSKINLLMLTVEPPKRFDGDIKKNFRSILVEAIINSYFESYQPSNTKKKKIKK